MGTLPTGADYFWEGKRIRLRPKAEDDWQLDLQEWRDTESMRLLDYTVHPPSCVEREKKRNEERMNRHPDNGMVWSIETIECDLVGSIALNGIDQKNGTFHFSMRIAREHRRKGYGEEALRIVLRYAFHELRLQKCNTACIVQQGHVPWHYTDHYNRPSRRLPKKLGYFQYGEGLFSAT
jgi:RimJ/RimL family protein N-acetyltransferase